jgi:hypothetical protein
MNMFQRFNGIGKVGAVTVVGIILAGCASGTYQTNASDTQLSAYAGQAVYPRQLIPAEAPHLFSSIAPDATITLYNAGDDAVSDFELWVNQVYTLHVAKLDAKSTVSIAPGTLYNKTGANIAGVPASSINTVQVYYEGKLWDVQGPIIPH